MTLNSSNSASTTSASLNITANILSAPNTSSMMGSNDSDTDASDRDLRPHTGGYYPVLVVMAVMIVTAIVGNVCNMLVIARCTQLRHSLSNFFIMSLCTSDLLAATLVMPMAASTYAVGEWPFGQFTCDLAGFATSLFMFVSMTTLCVISVERYYSIRLPMHHAAHMSVSKTVVTLVMVWLWALLLASLPLMGLGSYEFRHHRYHCSFTWHQGPLHKVYVALVATLCFVVPGLVLVAMYLGIFRVAKQAATQVRPVPSDTLRGSISTANTVVTQSFAKSAGKTSLSHQAGPSTSAHSTWCKTIDNVVLTTVVGNMGSIPRSGGPEVQNVRRASDSDSIANGDVGFSDKSGKRESRTLRNGSAGTVAKSTCTTPRSLEDSGIHSQGSDPLPASSEGVVLRANTLRPLQGHLKAAKTLLMLLSAYTALWGPYFVLHLHGISYGHVDAPDTTELVTLWLGFGSFAVNPFLYGWMNKAIREELIVLYRHIFCRWCCCSRCSKNHCEDDMPFGPSDEDFLQFLERTSQAPGVANGRSSNVTKQDVRPEMSEVNIDSSDPF